MKSVFTDEYTLFLQHLITARKEAGLTQQELASKLSKPQSFVSKYERKERRIDVVEYVIIALALNIDPCQILKDIENNLSAKGNSE